MNPLAPFLNGIREARDEDGPRLMLADFLAEQGDSASVARSEFIRYSCLLHRLTRDEQSYREYAARRHQLLREHWRTWFEPFCRPLDEPPPRIDTRPWWERWRKSPPPSPSRWHFVSEDPGVNAINLKTRRAPPEGGLSYLRLLRGFVEVAWMSFGIEFREIGDALIAREPIRHLGYSLGNSSAEEAMRELAAWSGLRTIEELSLWDGIVGDVGLRLLLSSPSLTRLTRFTVSRKQIGDDGALAISETAGLANLRYLQLDGNEIGNHGALYLARSQYLRRLELLILTENPIGFSGGEALKDRFGSRVLLPPAAL